ncbi:ISAs1 family transposase [Candidatus Gottesmanbacteria bacterium]|nr:ISAs1 family transposase [Candidatus Gottesmanbacteria bacterium]
MLLSRSLCNEYTSTLKSCPVFLIEPAPVTSLWYFLHTITDYRRAQGKRHPLPTILILAVLAICSGADSFQAVSEWAVNYQCQLKSVVPFLAFHTPDKSTFHRVFAHLDTESFELALGNFLQSITHLQKGEGIALDGKTTAKDRLHLVAAFAHKAQAVLFQKATDTKGKELILAPLVLERVSVKDRIITADALHTHRGFCETIVKSGGGYVLIVKGNQEKLQEDLKLFFENPPFKAGIETYQALEKSKGRIEKRMLWMSQDLTEYLNWPGLTHVFKVQRDRSDKTQKTTEVIYGIASLPEEYSSIQNLGRYLRGHWSIENKLHRVRDVSFHEDSSTIRTGKAPQVMAMLRNLVISVFKRGTIKSYPQAFRRFSAHPEELFAFLGLNQVKIAVI